MTLTTSGGTAVVENLVDIVVKVLSDHVAHSYLVFAHPGLDHGVAVPFEGRIIAKGAREVRVYRHS
jgi:hypothetical protein